MDNNELKQISIAVEKQGDNFIFSTNDTLQNNNEEIEFDLNSVKEIFELNPIPSKEIVAEDGKQTITFNMSYDVDNEKFLIELKIENEIKDTRDITLHEMLLILKEAYQNNTYITSNAILTNKVSDMLNEKINSLLKEGLIPVTNFFLRGKGSIKSDGSKTAIFDRAYVIPAENKIVLLEIVGNMPSEGYVTFEMESDLGVKFKLDNMKINKEEDNEVLGISYISLSEFNNLSMVEKIEIDKIEEFNFESELNTIEDSVVSSYDRKILTIIREAVKALNNKNSEDDIVNYVKKKKDILYSTSTEDYLESQVDDLFDDMF